MNEIDSVVNSRGKSGRCDGDSELQRTTMELLNQLDGFELTNHIEVIMATSRMNLHCCAQDR